MNLAQAARIFEDRRSTMLDAIFVAATIAFFALSLAYVKFCDRIR